MLVPLLPILQGAGAIGFGFLINSKFFVDFVIKVNKALLPFGSNPKYISFMKVYLKIAKIFFLVCGIGFIIFGIISLFLVK